MGVILGGSSGFVLSIALLLAASAWSATSAAAPRLAQGSSRGLTRAHDDLAAREYWASGKFGSLQAPNRAHDLRIWFTPTGIRVADRSRESRKIVGVSLAHIGRAGTPLAKVGPGFVSSERERVEIRRAGLVEWYRNSRDGLAQGFELTTPPEGAGALVLELAIRDAVASLEGDAIELRSEASRRLSYGEVAARDAQGRVLPARLEAPDPQRVRLVVEDTLAAYPLALDLLLIALHPRLETDQAEASFGISVAGAGDVDGDGYDDVIIGAHRFDGGEIDEGAAFVYLGSRNGIPDGAAPASVIQSNQQGARLGSVAGAGDVNGDGYDDVIVGAQRYASGQANEGAAFVFLGGRTGIVASGDPENADARLESDHRNAYFGASVAGAGDVNRDGYADVIVTANGYETSASETDEGAAFVFLGSGAGIADGNAAGAHAQLETNQLGGNLGSAASAGDVNGDGYGDVIVGANAYDAPDINEGAAFVFLGSAAGIADGNPATADSRFESDQARSFFGSSVAAGDFNGDGYGDVAIGGGNYDAPDPNEGAVFVFLGSPEGLGDGNPRTADAVFESNQAGAFMGAVASAGDVAGDAADDLIIGAHTYDNGELNEGAAFLFLGSRAGLESGSPATAAAQLESNQVGGDLGAAVASAGDVNGDGADDVIVGAPLFGTGEGAAFIYRGDARRWCGPNGAPDRRPKRRR